MRLGARTSRLGSSAAQLGSRGWWTDARALAAILLRLSRTVPRLSLSRAAAQLGLSRDLISLDLSRPTWPNQGDT